MCYMCLMHVFGWYCCLVVFALILFTSTLGNQETTCRIGQIEGKIGRNWMKHGGWALEDRGDQDSIHM